MKACLALVARHRRLGSRLLSAIGALLVLASLGSGPVAPAAAQTGQRDLVDTIRAEPQFSIFARAIESAGLVESLKGPGPFTVFVPTNEAFERLPPGTLDALLRDPESLRAVLTYHVAPDLVTAAQVVQAPSVTNTQGRQIRVNVTGDVVRMNNSLVLRQDVRATNGVIHVVDTVWIVAALGPGRLPTAGDADGGVLAMLAAGLALILAGVALRMAARPS
jgi:uncharacterized surface protein with fasciclin (FAS1) repeats